MIRIIENQPPIEYEVVCQSCGTRLAYTRDDIELKSGAPFWDAVITCPSCHDHIWLNVLAFDSAGNIAPRPKHTTWDLFRLEENAEIRKNDEQGK